MGRALGLEYVKYRVLGWLGTGYRYSPRPPTQPYPPRVHPYPPMPLVYISVHGSAEQLMAVGLRSVDQLTLSAKISGFRGMTEVYNLVKLGRTNNHSFIPGNE